MRSEEFASVSLRSKVPIYATTKSFATTAQHKLLSRRAIYEGKGKSSLTQGLL